jgi:hypothetical protein
MKAKTKRTKVPVFLTSIPTGTMCAMSDGANFGPVTITINEK